MLHECISQAITDLFQIEVAQGRGHLLGVKRLPQIESLLSFLPVQEGTKRSFRLLRLFEYVLLGVVRVLNGHICVQPRIVPALLEGV